MEFGLVLRTFADFFEREKIRYSLVGGLAMQAWGLSRLTRDADFAVDFSASAHVIAFAESLGYETIHVSPGYSNHVHDGDLGRVDFLYLQGTTAERVLSTAVPKSVFPDIEVPVARPEILAAMKGFAMKNRPMRVLLDSRDVEFLMNLPETDTEAVRDYYSRLGLLELLDAIRRNSGGR
ncbi:MAG TPA: hypothetical protein VFL80_08240 [Thermoanaerobaculia bacterium]|nr:hypothetical protein [Thermoanaerobaculia bacterium]